MPSPDFSNDGASPSFPPSHDLTRFPPLLRGKRILLCAESFGPVNGVSRTTLMLVNHLRAHGAQVAVVAPRNHTNQDVFSPPPSPTLLPADQNRQQPEVRVAGYPLPFNPELSIVYPVRTSTLHARTFGPGSPPPDLIYLASPASLGFQVMLQLRQQPAQRQIPVLCNFQTDLSGYCSILFPAPLSHLAVLALDAAQGYLFRHPSVKTVFYPSRSVKRYLVRNRVPAPKLELLTRGVDTHLFAPERRSEALRQEIAPRGQVVFVVVSRIAGEKGFDFLAKAAAELDARGLDFTLYIVGGNRNPGVEEAVRDLFDRRLRARGKVLFAGFKVGDELATAYASGDVFLHGSVTETFGLVVLEAMASGVPVVARDEGGPSDIVQHGDTGFLVPPDDLGGFVAKALRLAHDVVLRKRMAGRARAAACEATWESINNKVAWRMADIIEERRREQSSPSSGSWLSPQQRMPIDGLLMMNKTVREAVTRSFVDARLLGGLGIIMTFWIVTGCYVLLTECLLWAKGRTRTGEHKMVM